MTETKDQSLAKLLAQARARSKADRINLRSDIAAFGAPAIEAVAPWLDDPEFAAFAVRVITEAGRLGSRAEAIAALERARPNASPTIRRDIEEGLGLLGARRSAAAAATPTAKEPVPISDNLYERLVESARLQQTMTYTEAGQIVGLSMRNPNHRRLLGQQLGVISAYETEHGRPMLSAIVIHKGEKPGSGFFQLGEEIGLKSSGDDDGTFADRELGRVFSFWREAPASIPEDRSGHESA